MRRKKLDFGISFLSALRERYIHVEEEAVDGEGVEDDMVIQGIQVEILNKKELIEEQSHLDELKIVSLMDVRVNGTDKESVLQATVPNVEQLNLSKNPLLAAWADVVSIAKQLPKLQKLNISENELMVFEKDASEAGGVAHLKVLYMNKMKLGLEQLECTLPSCPNLNELYLCYNCISELRCMNVSLLENIVVLFLDGNGISKWSEVMALSSLPKLQTLSLNDNNLTEVTFESLRGANQPQPFQALKALSLYHNKIMGWNSLNEINTLPSLIDLRFKNNPLLEGDTPFNSRQLVIARVGQLTALNGSEVPKVERQIAQQYYLKRYASWWVSSNTKAESKAAFELEHPRYSHLVEVHGPPDEAMLLTKKGIALKDKLVSVTLRLAGDSDVKEYSKKLPRDMSVQKLKGLIQRLFKIDFPDQVLSYTSQKTGDEYQLEDDLKDIGFYAIQNGDVILVHHV